MEKRKRKREPSSSLRHADAYTIPALMLAAISNFQNPYSKSLIKRCLNRLRLSLLSKPSNRPSSPQQTLLHPIVSFLPVLLKSKCVEIASAAAEIVGTASLLSFEMNEIIALDCETVNAIVLAAVSSERRISLAACNAVLDLSTTSIGRERLLGLSAVETLMFGFLQIPKSSSTLLSLCNMDNGIDSCPRIMFEEDELPLLILGAVITLINTCTNEQLEKISRKLSEPFLVYLKELWIKVHNRMLFGHTSKFSGETHFYLSNVGTNNLAESIFRLSNFAGELTSSFPYEVVKRSIFGSNESSLENFMLNHWEISPSLIRRLSKSLDEQDDVFRSFVHFLNSKESIVSSLSSILRSLVSCPPFASDELDIGSFLKEVNSILGCPIIYQQDIRVLRTDRCLRTEVHFFPEISDPRIKSPSFFSIDDVLKCEEAYKEGYTIALRGMEFRFKSIAAIAEGLASLFGLPSVGVNLYLTPPNSQGLARHCDDHCVFVCQVLGSKQWTFFSQPIVRLPHLYEPLDSLHGSAVESSLSGCRQIILREGDVLYIPRGFAHEACTLADNGESNVNDGFSLHLTFGIEVEPPFEWGGFVQVALHSWNLKHKQLGDNESLEDSVYGNMKVMCVELLHVMMRIIGDYEPTFRKACLVCAVPLLSDTHGQKNIFSDLINKVNNSEESRLLEAVKCVQVAIEENKEDPFPWMSWIRHLNPMEGCDLMMGKEALVLLFDQHKVEAEAAFMQVKSRFCSEVVFEDAVESYKLLLDKYKAARKQYMNGMLALHSN